MIRPERCGNASRSENASFLDWTFPGSKLFGGNWKRRTITASLSEFGMEVHLLRRHFSFHCLK
jgi:hypothetical protein